MTASPETAPILFSQPHERGILPQLRALLLGSGTLLILGPLLLLTNLVQLSSRLVLPFSRRGFYRINRECPAFWWGLCDLAAKYTHRIQFVVTGDDLPKNENALLIANHQQLTDVLALFPIARVRGRLGDLKWFAKESLRHVPGVGWGLTFIGCVFLKRDWFTDKARIERTFQHLIESGIPYWLISFVEGTRITPEKLRKSREHAVKRCLVPPSYTLVPRVKGFSASVQGLRGSAVAVYDVTIGYPKGIPSLWQYISGQVSEIHLHLKRYGMETLPNDEEGLARWLSDRFSEKEAWLGSLWRAPVSPTPAADSALIAKL